MEIFHPIICDDVRKEINGKEILIGVYVGEIIVQKIPAMLNLSVWIPFLGHSIGAAPIEFKVIGPHEVEYSQGAGQLNVVRTDLLGSMAIVGVVCHIQSAGTIKFMIRQAGIGDYQTVREIPVRAGRVQGAMQLPQ